MIADKEKIVLWFSSKRFLRLSAFICVNLWLILLTSCATKPSEMRSLVPAESLVYLETNDLANALQPIVDSKPFTEAAKKKPDLSVLKGVQMAVAVLGFEATEEKLTDEQSVGSVKPRFVAVVDTHAWNYQANGFAEQKLGAFVADIYGGEPKLEKSDKGGGKYYAWSADDGKKAFALVIDSIIYFANDETAIDKCLAVRRGESDSIIKNDKIKPIEPGTLARGYITNDGVNQIAALVGMKLASEASDESEVQTAIAGILPQLIRGTVSDVTWTMTKGEQGVEDKYQVGMPQDVANIFKETIATSDFQMTDFEEFVPRNAPSITRYLLKDPLVAWKSLIATAQSKTDPLGAKMIGVMAGSIFEEYGIADPELFLGNVDDKRVLTARPRQDKEEMVVITRFKDIEKLKRSITKEIDISKPAAMLDNWLFWESKESDVMLAVNGNIAILGVRSAIVSCLAVNQSGSTFNNRPRFKQFEIATDVSLTIANDLGPDADLLNLFAEPRGDASPMIQTSFTATYFDEKGMHRRSLSDFGLIGQIIAQLADN